MFWVMKYTATSLGWIFVWNFGHYFSSIWLVKIDIISSLKIFLMGATIYVKCNCEKL